MMHSFNLMVIGAGNSGNNNNLGTSNQLLATCTEVNTNAFAVPSTPIDVMWFSVADR